MGQSVYEEGNEEGKRTERCRPKGRRFGQLSSEQKKVCPDYDDLQRAENSVPDTTDIERGTVWRAWVDIQSISRIK
jgi:hypothetical protein